MKQHYKLPNPRRRFHGIKLTFFYSLITLLLYGCFLKQDRTTTVYGTITDQNGLPVDSILVIVSGIEFFQATRLKELYSNDNGEYEVVIDVAKKYDVLDVAIPAFPKENPKFIKNYKTYDVLKNGGQTNNCCTAQIGKKTEYDFQLNPK